MVEADPEVHRDDLAAIVVEEFIFVGEDVCLVFLRVEYLRIAGLVREDIDKMRRGKAEGKLREADAKPSQRTER